VASRACGTGPWTNPRQEEGIPLSLADHKVLCEHSCAGIHLPCGSSTPLLDGVASHQQPPPASGGASVRNGWLLLCCPTGGGKIDRGPTVDGGRWQDWHGHLAGRWPVTRQFGRGTWGPGSATSCHAPEEAGVCWGGACSGRAASGTGPGGRLLARPPRQRHPTHFDATDSHRLVPWCYVRALRKEERWRSVDPVTHHAVDARAVSLVVYSDPSRVLIGIAIPPTRY